MSATTSALPTIGSQLAGGTYAGITTGTDGAPYALILLDDKPAERLTWRKAINWAKKLDAELPTRPEGAMLFANLKDSFEPAAHWTSESLDSAWAWFQHFYYGTQYDGRQNYELRARAVRRLPIQSLVI